MTEKPTASQAIYKTLSSDPDLRRHVGLRIFPIGPAPQGTEDGWITFIRVGGGSEAAHDGDGDLENPRFQFNIFSTDPKKVDIILKQLKKLLHAQRINIDGTDVVFLHEDSHDTYENDTKLFGAICDFQIQL